MTPRSCRICGAAPVQRVGSVEYLQGFSCEIFDCHTCGCRWTPSDASVHAQLHAKPAISYYRDYTILLEQCRGLARARDLDGLERLLRTQAKYRFVLDRLRELPPRARVLEWGCSRGYLTAASILAEREVLGVDVSVEAIDAARAAFGDHFACTDSPRVEGGAPYDAIYHVGLIGCVPDPLGLTRRLAALLGPGGRMFFNAPNRDALFQRHQLWFDSAPAPELITLFPSGFFRRYLGDRSNVVETIARTSPQASMVKSVTRWFGPAWRQPAARAVESEAAHRWTQPRSARWAAVEAAVAKFAAVTGLHAGSWPEEYGYFVEMTQ